MKQNISNNELVALLIKYNLFKEEEIERKDNSMVKPTREEAMKLVKDYEDTNPVTYPVKDKDGTEIKQISEKDANADNTLEAVKDADGNIIYFLVKDAPPVPPPVLDEKPEWSQEKQKYPNRYYTILRRLKHVDEKGKKVYENLPQYFVNGMWCEDTAGTVECSYYENLRPEVVKQYRALGIIR